MRVLGAIAAVAALAVPAGARAAGPVVVGGPGSYIAGYTNPVVAVQVGGELTYVHADLQGHDVVHDVLADPVGGSATRAWCVFYPGSPCPVFWSENINTIGDYRPVLGLDQLVAGRVYPFYCTTHLGMKGRLLALP